MITPDSNSSFRHCLPLSPTWDRPYRRVAELAPTIRDPWVSIKEEDKGAWGTRTIGPLMSMPATDPAQWGRRCSHPRIRAPLPT